MTGLERGPDGRQRNATTAAEQEKRMAAPGIHREYRKKRARRKETPFTFPFPRNTPRYAVPRSGKRGPDPAGPPGPACRPKPDAGSAFSRVRAIT